MQQKMKYQSHFKILAAYTITALPIVIIIVFLQNILLNVTLHTSITEKKNHV